MMTSTGISAGDLRAHQDDLRGVVDPDQYNDDGSRGSVGRFKPLFTDIETDGSLPEFEEERCEDRPKPDVGPCYRDVRQLKQTKAMA